MNAPIRKPKHAALTPYGAVSRLSRKAETLAVGSPRVTLGILIAVLLLIPVIPILFF